MSLEFVVILFWFLPMVVVAAVTLFVGEDSPFDAVDKILMIFTPGLNIFAAAITIVLFVQFVYSEITGPFSWGDE